MTILRMKNGEMKECYHAAGELHLKNLYNLWNTGDLNFMPKAHSLLAHALEQAKAFQGVGDTLEDDIEHMHQISARIESYIGQMKNKEQQAYVHSSMEAIQCNVKSAT
jgi:ferritin-like protein